jgi:3,4-dihydroxy 2-butanone 4-phosphate synthase/GTP cyclohydrolase II
MKTALWRLPDLYKIADKFDLKIVSIEALVAYRMKNESLITREVSVNLPTKFGNFELVAYKQNTNNMDHLALVKGSWKKNDPVLVRVHSSCVTGDIFASCKCDCGAQLHEAMQMIDKEGKGIVLYMNQEGRGIGLLNKLKAYHLQELGKDTVEANIELGFKADERDYGIGAQILRDLGATKLRLITNNPTKRAGLIGYGLEIVENIPLMIKANKHNLNYMKVKRDKMGHQIEISE